MDRLAKCWLIQTIPPFEIYNTNMGGQIVLCMPLIIMIDSHYQNFVNTILMPSQNIRLYRKQNNE